MEIARSVENGSTAWMVFSMASMIPLQKRLYVSSAHLNRRRLASDLFTEADRLF
ncbi:hypothetical protein [Rossellomorea vietnamensis]|uniref:hypothetical protein n=1 Tax=Rossellomorea vietnamensis TaxID=218284 RepID=UPI001653BD12|nr:hypothetical protein [Rossellomorea vietnamensis]